MVAAPGKMSREEKSKIIRPLIKKGLKNKEIAERTGIPLGTVNGLSGSIRKELKNPAKAERIKSGDNSDRHKCRTCQYRHSDAGGCDYCIHTGKGNCEAVVKFECMPAAVYPDLIQVVLKNMDHGLQIIGDILTLKELLKIILEFLKKCIGYEKEVVLDDNNGDIIEITDETTDEELQGKILAMLIEQERKTGKDISKIIDNK